MIITKNYISMCEQTKQLQKKWKPKAGDYVQLIKNKQIYLVSSVEKSKDKKKVVFYTNIINGNDSWCYLEFFKNNFIWLPTQEQLWDMLEGTVLKKLDNFIANLTITVYETVQEYLLNHVMEHNYGKMWLNKKWEAM